MPISGIVIRPLEHASAAILEQLAVIPGVEVHGTVPDGRIVAVVEADTVQGEVDLVSQLHDIDGIVSVQMAYHNFEDLAEQQDAHPADGHP